MLTITNLQKRYPSDGVPVRALRGVELSVDAGEFVSVIGPSGCGKSTLLNLIAGLDKPSGGEITIEGQPLGELNERQLALVRRRHVGIVFQFLDLLLGMSVEENVMLPAIIAGATRVQARRRAHDLLDLLGLLRRASTRPAVLSGGDRQRLAIARALANRPSLLLADEPTAALDSAGAAEVLGVLGQLHRAGQTMLLATHDETVSRAADRVVSMRDGIITP